MCSFYKLKYELFLQHLEDSYNATDLIDKLNLSTNDLLIYLDEYIMDNLHLFTDDLAKMSIYNKETELDD